MGRGAAGEELAGAHAAGESLEGCRLMRLDHVRRSENGEKPSKG